MKYLHKEFLRRFNKENFLAVFSYMDGYIDIDASSELGKYYLKSSSCFGFAVKEVLIPLRSLCQSLYSRKAIRRLQRQASGRGRILGSA